jgi:hypothetical protein
MISPLSVFCYLLGPNINGAVITMAGIKSQGEFPPDREPPHGPGSGIVILLGVVALVAMLFGLLIGLLL